YEFPNARLVMESSEGVDADFKDRIMEAFSRDAGDSYTPFAVEYLSERLRRWSERLVPAIGGFLGTGTIIEGLPNISDAWGATFPSFVVVFGSIVILWIGAHYLLKYLTSSEGESSFSAYSYRAVLASVGLIIAGVIVLPILAQIIPGLLQVFSSISTADILTYSTPFIFIGMAGASGRTGAQGNNPIPEAWELYMRGYRLIDSPDGLDDAIENLRRARAVLEGPYKRIEKSTTLDATILYLCIMGNLGVALLRKGDGENDQDRYYQEACIALEEGYRAMRRFVERKENRKIDPAREPLITPAVAKMNSDLMMIADNILTRLGQTYIALNKEEKAEEIFEQLLVMYPRSWMGLVGLAASKVKFMKLGEAKEIFLKALDVAEEDLDIAEEALSSAEG
ncbi:MAG TPA: hypothetical protein PLV52_07450, partial [Candidatus Omnitrophota bacterium]|nr:hypothetical protein [Candidatus Omnitrophota bacterium]